MREFRLGQAADLLGISTDRLRRLADQGRIETTRTTGGQRIIAGAELARFAVELASTPEDDDEATHLSARNRFTGLVTRIVRDTVMAQVEIQAGAHRIVSLISTEAVDELGLEPGDLAVAVVKSTSVVIEAPR